jgi:hypothetical protein
LTMAKRLSHSEKIVRQVWLNPSNPLRTNRMAACAGRGLVPPLAWNFARPCSGARRVTWVTNNACRIGRPVELDLCKAGFSRATWTQQHAQCFACGLGRQSLAYEP